MSVDESYLAYPRRKKGMDHDLYATSFMPERHPVAWPGGKALAVWIVPILEFFPLDMKPEPIVPPGGMTRPYPDYWNYTLTDYGNRVGIYRLLNALQMRGMPFSAAINARLAVRHPTLLRDCIAGGAEIIAHGRDMGTIHGDYLDETRERGIVEDARAQIADQLGHAPRGWLSPAMALSQNTTRLVAQSGFDYTCDWVNDELPYGMSVADRPFASMPMGYELSDLRLIHEYKHAAWEWQQQILTAIDFLLAEAARKQAGRMIALPVRPWILGAPHRIAAFERVLDRIAGTGEAWVATGADILDAWRQAQ